MSTIDKQTAAIFIHLPTSLCIQSLLHSICKGRNSAGSSKIRHRQCWSIVCDTTQEANRQDDLNASSDPIPVGRVRTPLQTVV